MATERREIWFEGHVQGVGFRYTVAGLARRYPIVGFVQNLPDGRVHLVCEGESDELELFLADIVDRMRSFIRGKKQDRRPSTGQMSGFEIRH